MTRTPFIPALFILVSGFAATMQAGNPDRPNVVILIIDDLNDYGPLHAYPRVQTQNIDLLATESIRFTNSHCTAPICVPSRTSLFSGKNPWSTGSYYNQKTTWGHSQMAGMESFPETFKRNGYTTFGAGKLYHQGPGRERMDAMWDDQTQMNGGFGPFKPNPDGSPGRNFGQWHAWTGPDTDFPDVRTTDAAIRFLEQDHDSPFMLALGIYRPHTPLTAPKRFFDLYDRDALPLPQGFRPDDLDDLPAAGREMAVGRKRMDPENDADYRDFLRAYLACITFMDWNVGRVLDALRAGPHDEDTIVIFFSDHGFHWGEKYHHAKSTLWEQGTEASMMVRVPGLTRGGAVCDQPVSLIDVFPTLVDLCRLDTPPQGLDGLSLRPLLADVATDTWTRPAITSHGPGNASIRSARYRYIRYDDGSEELYDCLEDPYEWVNRIDDPALTAVREELAGYFPETWAEPIQNEGYRLW